MRFARGHGALGRRVRLTVSVYDVDHIFDDLKRLKYLDRSFDLKCAKFGSFKFVASIKNIFLFRYEFFVEGVGSGSGAVDPSGWGYFSVVPKWTIGGRELSLNSLSVCTHLTKLLGPLSEWEDRLSVAKEAGYNVIHLTPVQALGVSNSRYLLRNINNRD